MAVDIYQNTTDQIIAMLEKGTVPWRQTWSAAYEEPKNLMSRKGYRGINFFILAATQLFKRYESPYWLTFKQAQEKGGHVRKGEKGTAVIFWKIYKKEEDGKEVDLPVLRYYTVFNAEQCEGVECPAVEKPVFTEHERIEKAEQVQLFMPKRPRVEFTGGQPYYSPTRDLVVCPPLQQFDSAEEYYSALFHELGHSTGHESRLNRHGITGMHPFGAKEYSKEELVAEMTSAFLCAHCGIASSTLENSAAYLQGWLKTLRADKRLLISAAAQAQKAADFILNKQTTEQESKEDN